ncbi:carboxypeptidase-like regulatory domain-containing protein [Chitinophaga rhizophila]|uniref:Carboxypeptidase-like regulatory domain-containing protein n=1 Tax=Chitinophaga rhizophila TaxID=2866212 RepID=A0ABS7GBM2_9BACT|nr:carboxypeptidase-like regulatory domain-containing protein [Chitinophaga rhizophila]MBW8684816.1 carboxypeptidase-like regulatory domain-containing protein [Chitinophaga rhizophila]
MRNSTLLLKTILFFLLLFSGIAAEAQLRVYGTVYDRSGRFGMPYVSVISSSGNGTVTDSVGRYSINMARTDSISFSYQGKATMRIPVSEIPPNRPFDTKIHVDVTTLPTVVVEEKIRSYQADSIANRQEYRKVFDFSTEYISTGSTVVGLNIDALLTMRKNRRMEKFRNELMMLEQEKYEQNYIEQRFNRPLVKKLTGLESPDLDVFMEKYRPDYPLLLSFDNDYEYYRYLKDLSRYFKEDTRQKRKNTP